MAGTTREILHELGRGGVGIVVLARRSADARLVVVKTLRPELARNVTVRRAFFEEARVSSLLVHPNTVRVLDHGADADGTPFIEMEWTPGVTLQAIDDLAPLPLDLYVAVVSALLDGLDHAHHVEGPDGALHLVHRDVSPHNVLVGFDGSVKVLDFGIAKVRDSGVDTTSGLVKGKPTYLAPEQAARKPIDARTDLFAVGIMLFQHVAGRRLWEDATEPEIFYRLVHGEIPDLATLAPKAPKALCDVVRRALAADPAERFASARAMRDALVDASAPRADAESAIAAHLRAAFAEDIERFAHVTGTDAQRRPRSLRRSPVAWGLALVAVAGLALGATRIKSVPPAPPAVVVACASESACGEEKHCLDNGSCTSLEHEGCTTLLPEVTPTSRPIFVGAMFPLTGPDGKAYGQSNARAAELAVREINRLGGVPTPSGRRPLGLVSCDDANDPEGRARHLARTTVAVTGFRSSDEALALVRDVFVPARVLSVSALNTSPLLAQLPAGDPRLFFRATAGATAFAEPLARAVATMLVPLARKRASLPESTVMRVAVLRAGNATGVAYAEMVMRALERYEGITSKEVATGREGADAGAALGLALAELAKDPPHVVIALSDGLFGSVVAPLEARLTNDEARRPIWVGATPWEDADYEEMIRTRPARSARFFAVSWPTSHRALGAFVERYKESFGEVLLPSTASPAPYDAVYLIAYAAAAARSERLDGPTLSRAIDKLMPEPGARDTKGEVIPVGPNDFVAGGAAAAAGRQVDLSGILSRLDFDRATGDTAVDAVLLCTTYEAASRKVDGTDTPITRGLPRCSLDRDAGVPR